MTRFDSPTPFQELQLLQRHLVSQFGLRKIILALVLELIRPQARRPETTQMLDDHLRKDIGLPPKLPQSERWWNAPF